MSMPFASDAPDVPDNVVQFVGPPAAAPVPRAYRVTLDRQRLERVLAALAPPPGVPAGSLHLACRRQYIVFSTEWAGLRLAATLGLSSHRNTLPRDGLDFAAHEPFGAVGQDGHLPLRIDQRRSRRVDLLIDPAAEQIEVAFGGEMLRRPVTFVAPADPCAPRAVDVRLRSALWRVGVSRAEDVAEDTEAGPQFTFGVGTLVSNAANGVDDVVPDLPLDALAGVLAHPGDLLSRPALVEFRGPTDASELRCSFDIGARSPTPPPSGDGAEGGCVGYLDLGCRAFDSHLQATGVPPGRGLDLTITCHPAARDLPTCEDGRTAQQDAASSTPPRRNGAEFALHLASKTAAWITEHAEAADRLLLGLCRDGSARVLLAQGSDPVTFVAAPTIVTVAMP